MQQLAEQLPRQPRLRQTRACARSHAGREHHPVTSRYSPDLADALERAEIDRGFLRVEPRPNVTYQVIAREPIVAILPSDHRLARKKSIDPAELSGEPFIGFSEVPHV